MRSLTPRIYLGLMLLSSVATAAENRYHPNHLFVKMKGDKNLVNSPLISSSKKIIEGLYLVNTKSADQLAQTLASSPAVEYTQKDFYAGKRAMPKLEELDPIKMHMKGLGDLIAAPFNDPEVSKLWAFGEKNGLDVVGAYETFPLRKVSEIVVAVVDTGVDHDHEDLKDVMWTNEGEVPGDGVDNDDNGYVDDIHGINVLVRDSSGNPTMNTMASHWHGTHVSGTIAAKQNNHLGIAGVASNVKIMALRTVPDDADELDSNIIEAYKYAAENGAKIINCSFGKSQNEGGMVVRDVINEIGEKYGVLVVASAGNDSMGPFSWHDNDRNPKFPASFDSENLLVIASTTNRGTLSSFSNVGKVTVDVASPGSDVYSTVNKNKYAMASGTSMAAPNASGVAAMVLGYFPDLSPVQLKQVLMSSVVKVNGFESKMSSGGRLNLKKALTQASFIK